jgi:hypothetical protein
VKLLAVFCVNKKAEDNTEPILRDKKVCNDYPTREYIQVNGNRRYPVEYRIKI